MIGFIARTFTKPSYRIAFGIYVAGIAGSTVNGIVIQNKRLENKTKDVKYNVNYIDYAMESLSGAIMGLGTGIWWPITAIGQGALQLAKLNNLSKNN